MCDSLIYFGVVEVEQNYIVFAKDRITVTTRSHLSWLLRNPYISCI